MTSYFEISGTIIESDSPSNPSFQSTVSVVERPERGRNSTRSQGFSLKTSSDEGRGSLARHWVRSVTYPTQRLIDQPTGVFGLPIFGVRVHLELIGKQYDYFIKGEDPWINYQD